MSGRLDLAWDALAVLNLFDAVNAVGSIDGPLKAQKITFLYELNGQKRGVMAGHMRFSRYKQGPYSWQLPAMLEMLTAGGFLDPDSRQLTARGRYVLEYAKPEASEPAAQSFEIADRMARDYGAHTGPELTKLVYAMRVPVFDFDGQLLKMRALRLGVDILRPSEQSGLADPVTTMTEVLTDLKAEFKISPDSLNPARPELRERALEAVRSAITELTH